MILCADPPPTMRARARRSARPPRRARLHFGPESARAPDGPRARASRTTAVRTTRIGTGQRPFPPASACAPPRPHPSQLPLTRAACRRSTSHPTTPLPFAGARRRRPRCAAARAAVACRRAALGAAAQRGRGATDQLDGNTGSVLRAQLSSADAPLHGLRAAREGASPSAPERVRATRRLRAPARPAPHGVAVYVAVRAGCQGQVIVQLLPEVIVR